MTALSLLSVLVPLLASAEPGASPACTPQDASGCAGLAQKESDPARKAELLGIACEAGNADACNRLGVLHGMGRGVPKDRARELELYRKACDGGSPWGCHNLGKEVLGGEGDAAAAEAAGLFGKACDGGLAQACNLLGLLLDEGKRVPKDPARAAAVYGKGCDAGLPAACTNLALSLREGTGVPKDPARAMELFRKACDAPQPSFEACNFAGVLAWSGNGVPKDVALAAGLQQKACEGREAWGCYNVARMYRDGVHFEKDPARAESLMKRACSGGVRDACPPGATAAAEPARGQAAATASPPLAPGATGKPAGPPAGSGGRFSFEHGLALGIDGGPAFVRSASAERLGIGRTGGGEGGASVAFRYRGVAWASLNVGVMSFTDKRPFTNLTTGGVRTSTVYGIAGGGAVGLQTPPMRIGAGRSPHRLNAGLGVGYEASSIGRVIEDCVGCDHQHVRVKVGAYVEPSLTWTYRSAGGPGFGVGLLYRIFGGGSDLASAAILRLFLGG